MDVGDLIGSFMTGTYTVTRRGASTVVDGRAVPAVPSTLSIVASVQPATGRDLERLPEGQRSRETRVVFTPTQLLIATQGAGLSDIVAIDGSKWEVQQVARWDAPPGTDAPYWRCIVQAAT